MTFLNSLLSILFLTTLLTASPLTTPKDRHLTMHTNLTAPLRSSNPRCIDSPDWVTPSFVGGDCHTAIVKFHRETVVWNTVDLSFLSYQATPPLSSIWDQETPRRYRYKSCTLAVVMLKDLPHEMTPARPYPGIDTSSYASLERAAREILASCISPVLGKGGANEGGGVGFTNPAGFDILGTF